jgi:hypothetical protein
MRVPPDLREPMAPQVRKVKSAQPDPKAHKAKPEKSDRLARQVLKGNKASKATPDRQERSDPPVFRGLPVPRAQAVLRVLLEQPELKDPKAIRDLQDRPDPRDLRAYRERRD